MTPDPYALVALTVRVLSARLGRRWRGEPHTPDCRIGQAIDGYRAPTGAPCSEICRLTQVALAGWRAVQAELDGQVPRQLVMDEEGAA